jgi:DNA-directed RNA polymerase specialized sigma24 family protein
MLSIRCFQKDFFMSRKVRIVFKITDPIAKAKFNEYYVNFQSRIAGFLRACFVMNEDDNDQLTQETFLRVGMHIGFLCHESDDRLWAFLNNEEIVVGRLFKTARYLSKQLHAKKNVQLRHREAVAQQRGSAIDERTLDIKSEIDIDSVKQEVATWPEQHRRIVECRAEGKTVDQIASAIGRSKWVVYRILSSTTQDMRRKFRGPI